uniref:Shisa N-terminal domain-containing protein n=1 Tax=Amphiprion percula TaxID=161767 RepID=A0A3P8S7E5_AMPPE
MRFLAQPLISLCYTAFHHDLVFLHLTAKYCTSYTDWNGVSHRTQQCSMSYYCCGDCTYKYCCRDQTQRITQSQQERSCFNQDTLILGSVFPIILCVGLIICCVAPCCLCYKKCRKGGNRTHTGNPGYPHPAPYNPGMPMYPLNPHQVYAEPPQSDEHVQPPYNPSYDPNSQTS